MQIDKALRLRGLFKLEDVGNAEHFPIAIDGREPEQRMSEVFRDLDHRLKTGLFEPSHNREASLVVVVRVPDLHPPGDDLGGPVPTDVDVVADDLGVRRGLRVAHPGPPVITVGDHATEVEKGRRGEMDVAEQIPARGVFRKCGAVAPANQNSSGVVEKLHIPLRRGKQLLGMIVRPEQDGCAVGNIKLDDHAATLTDGICARMGCIVEEGHGAVGVPARVMLPGKPGRVAVGQIGEIVGLPTESPQDIPRVSVDANDSVHMPRRDHVITLVRFVHAVDVEVIKGTCALSSFRTERFVCVLDRKMLGRAPLKEQFASFNIELLENRIEDPAQLGASHGPQICRGRVIYRYQGGLILADREFMEIAAVVTDRVQRVPLGIGIVELDGQIGSLRGDG